MPRHARHRPQSGTTCRPLPMQPFLEKLVDGFVAAYGHSEGRKAQV
ncbi:hypothetical protein WME76_40440 [Sorangium sp. So ce119]